MATTPKRNPQVTFDQTVSFESSLCSFSSLASKRSARILRIPPNSLTSFKHLRTFPNIRVINLQNSPPLPTFSTASILVAFRSLTIRTINDAPVTDDDHKNAFRYSGLVTFALRQGMDCRLSDNPDEALAASIAFLTGQADGAFEFGDGSVTISDQADVYTWHVLDGDFNWKPIDGESKSLGNGLHFPLKCELKYLLTSTVPNKAIVIPEVDHRYHVYAELAGNATESGLLSVKAPLSASISWQFGDDGEVISSDSLVLPITAAPVGRPIICEIVPRPGLPPTRLSAGPVKPGEFRFRSVRLHGQLLENDEIGFEVVTRGTRATFKGVRILRSARHGEWENVEFIPAGPPADQMTLKYTLTIQDIGCVIRAVCITDGGAPPLMLTSSERVEPSAPRFVSASIFGSMQVGMPLFAIAQYAGGVQGKSRYDWSIGSAKGPVIVPSADDVGKTVSCLMTPIRSDGSIGKAFQVVAQGTIQTGRPMAERFLAVQKKTRSGRLQLAFADRPTSERLLPVREGQTVTISLMCDWVVVDSHGIHPVGTAKTFTAESNHTNGIIVIFTDDFFALVGQIEAAEPTVTNAGIICERAALFLTVKYQYFGGVEGRSVIQWNRHDGRSEVVVGFGRSCQIGFPDKGCTYRALITPMSLDGRKGKQTSSELFVVDEDLVVPEDRPKWDLVPAAEVVEGIPLQVVVQNHKVGQSIISLSDPLTKRTKVYWTWKSTGKSFHDGMTYTPKASDAGKVILVQVKDRIRDSVVSECELPAVVPGHPTISDLSLNLEEKQRVRVIGKYQGGQEGQSLVVWKAIRAHQTVPIEIARIEHDLDHQFIEIDGTFEGCRIFVEYTPVSTGQEIGETVLSEPLSIPTGTSRDTALVVTAVDIVPTANYTGLHCQVKTSSPCTKSFVWGYVTDGEELFTEDVTPTRKVVATDFEYPVFCQVTIAGLDPITVEPSVPIPKLFTPEIKSATIQSRLSSEEAIPKQEFEVGIDYAGPPIQAKFIRWQRKIRDDWTTFLESETYCSLASNSEEIRAVVQVQAQAFDGSAKESNEFVTEVCRIDRINSILTRIAGTMKRAGKAEFEGKLLTGDRISICLENGYFFLKGPNSVIMVKTHCHHVQAEPSGQAAVALRARHGYSTEVTFVGKKSTGGLKFSAEQTRDLFLETLTLFTVPVDRGSSAIAQAAAAFKKAGEAQFDGKLVKRGETVSITLDNTGFHFKGSISSFRSNYQNVRVDTVPVNSVAFRGRNGTATVVAISEKTLPDGQNLTPEQARDLFVETFAAFAGKR